MRILGIAGSLRRDSLNRELLRLAAEEAPEGVAVELFGGLKEIPPYDADDEGVCPAAVERLEAAVRGADAVLFATPEYNSSVPGVLKNAVDWASRPELAGGPFWGKPVAVVSASPGAFGAIWAQAELAKVLKAVGARVVETNLAVARAGERLASPDDELRDDLRRVLDLLAEEAGAGAHAGTQARPVTAASAAG